MRGDVGLTRSATSTPLWIDQPYFGAGVKKARSATSVATRLALQQQRNSGYKAMLKFPNSRVSIPGYPTTPPQISTLHNSPGRAGSSISDSTTRRSSFADSSPRSSISSSTSASFGSTHGNRTMPMSAKMQEMQRHINALDAQLQASVKRFCKCLSCRKSIPCTHSLGSCVACCSAECLQAHVASQRW